MTIQTQDHNIVIIGAGQAAAACICQLNKLGYKGLVTVISNEMHHFYERPPLSKTIITDDGNINSCYIIRPESYEELQIHIIKANALDIDKVNKYILLSNGETVSYEKLLIATGGCPNQPFKDVNSEKIMTLRTIEDSLKIKELSQSENNIALIGGGWIGLELASSLIKMHKNVTVFELADRLCSRHLSEVGSAFLEQIHAVAGCHIKLNTKDIHIEKFNEKLALTSSNGIELFDLIIVGAGVSLNTQLAKKAELRCEQAIVVDNQMRTSVPDIFAAGDVAIHPSYGISLQTWANANESGAKAAYGILGINYLAQDELPWFWSDQYDYNIQILGLAKEDDLQLSQIKDTYALFLRVSDTGEFKQLISFNHPRVIKQAKRWLGKNNRLIDVELIKLSDDWVSLFK